METNQTIPDFLQMYVPEGGDLKFEPDTDEELENQKNGGFGGDAGGWGDGDNADGGVGWGEPAAKDSDAAAGDLWGAEPEADGDKSNGADAGDLWGAGPATGGADIAWG